MTTRSATVDEQLRELQAKVVKLEASEPPETKPVRKSKVKPMTPNVFKGRKEEDVGTWIFKVENYVKSLSEDTQEAYDFALTALEDDAATWFRLLPDPPTTWEALKKALLAQL